MAPTGSPRAVAMMASAVAPIRPISTQGRCRPSVPVMRLPPRRLVLRQESAPWGGGLLTPAMVRPIPQQAFRLFDRQQRAVLRQRTLDRHGREMLGHQVAARAAHDRIGGGGWGGGPPPPIPL